MAKQVMLLFETTGLAAAELERAGFRTICVDTDRPQEADGRLCLDWDILARESDLIGLAKECVLVFGMPPCTDLTSTGAAHFASKRERDPLFQEKALHLFRSVQRIGDSAHVPWAIENPFGVVSSMWRKWDHRFDPFEYGGYLPEDDTHPMYPDYIAPRDAYPKKTALWVGNGFTMPQRRPVTPEPGYSRQHRLLGGKSYTTKRIRSASPRGFFRALAEELR